MVIYCTNEDTRRHAVTVAAVSDEPLRFGKGYTVRKEMGEALLAQAPDQWSEERPGGEEPDEEKEEADE